MTNETTVLLQSCKHILHNHDKPSLSDVDEKTLFELAKENGLAPFLYATFKDDSISETFKKALKTLNLAYHKRHLQHEETIKRLRSTFNNHGIDFLFLKGVHLKDLYPSPHMRASGDIDVLLKDKQAVDAVEPFLKKAGFTSKMKNAQHDLYTDANGSTVEVHPTVYKAFSEKYDRLFENEWQHATHKDAHEYRFTPEFEICYLLYHLAKHFDASGVGLRSILDIGLYVQDHKDTLDFKYLDTLLLKGSLHTFYKTIIGLNQIYFDLAPLVTVDQTLSNARLNQLTAYIVTSGIHGKGKHFNMFHARRIREGQSANKVKVLLRILFPSMDTMKGIYPSLKKTPVLLPLFWVHRIFKITFKRFKTSVHKLKLLFSSSKEEAESTASMFEDIGL